MNIAIDPNTRTLLNEKQKSSKVLTEEQRANLNKVLSAIESMK